MVSDSGFEKTGRQFSVSGNTIKKWLSSFGLPHKKRDVIKWLRKELGIIEVTPRQKVVVKPKNIMQIDIKNNETICVFPSASDAAKALGIKRHDHILEVCENKRKSAYGFVWKYIE